MQPTITIPQNASGITINSQGQCRSPCRARPRRVTVGQIGLTRFVNKAGLQSIGDNLFPETPASGAPQDGIAGTDGFGDMQQAQSRAGQRRGGLGNLRSDRGAARL